MLVASLLSLVLAGCSTDGHAGVISTENAGRVKTRVVRSDSGAIDTSARVRLLKLSGDGSQIVVATQIPGADGGALFPEVPVGTYRVEATLSGGLRGASDLFVVDGGKQSDLVVVLLVMQSYQFVLVPSNGDKILSVWVDDTSRQALANGGAWVIPVVPGISDPVGVVVRRANGAVETVLYRLSWDANFRARLDLQSSGGSSPQVQSSIPHRYTIDSNTIALWTFDSIDGGKVRDESGNGHDLSSLASPGSETSPFGKSAVVGVGSFTRNFDTSFTPGPIGQIVYETRIWLDRYPSSSLHNSRSVVLGYYAGMKLAISDSGRVQMAGQRWAGSGWLWSAVETDTGAMPLGRWVDLSAACDQKSGLAWIWIDGKPVATNLVKQNSGEWRISDRTINPSNFTVGKDPQDGQNLTGKIDEIRISGRIPSSWRRFGVASP